MTRPRMIAIELEGFRGFAKMQRLSLDADAVLVRGDNGSGKTSLVDGLLWLFCGELQYLVERVRKLRRNERIVQNRFTDLPARVALELDYEGDRYVIVRRADENASTLEVTSDRGIPSEGETALANLFGHRSSRSLRTAVLTWGVLRQDAVRATLDTAGGALHDRLAGIVGLEQVSSFAAAVSVTARALQTQRTAARRSTEMLQRRHDEAVSRHLAAQGDVLAAGGGSKSLQSELAMTAQDLAPQLKLELPATTTLPVLREIGSGLSAVVTALNHLASLQRSLSQLPTAQKAHMDKAEREVSSAQEQFSIISQQGPAGVRLAQAALEALDGNVCPVCGQEVNEEELRTHLVEIVGHAEELFSSAQQASDALARARSGLAEVHENERIRHQREEEIRLAEAAVHRVFADLPYLSVGVPPLSETDPGSLAQRLEEFLEKTRAAYRAASEASGAHLERLGGEASALGSELESSRRELESVETRYERAKALERSAHNASETIVARALKDLEPSFAEVFDRLNPNPAFTELRARQDVLRNVNQVVPVVRDPQRGIDANPLLVFSEGQLNVVALSYFLGMALNAADAMLPFLILDDPLKALDTVSVLGFGDLCRRIRGERQLLVTTHDRRFADILDRKLAPREPGVTTIVHEFEGWTREGPSIRSTTPELADVIPLVQRRAS